MRLGGAQKAFFHFALESLAFCGSGVGVGIPEKVSLSVIAMVTSDIIGVSDVGAAAGNIAGLGWGSIVVGPKPTKLHLSFG